MSLITGSAYPRKMTGTTSLWKTIDRQDLETQGSGAHSLEAQDLGAQGLISQGLGVPSSGSQFGDNDGQYEGVDTAFTRTFSALSLGSQLTSPSSFVAPRRFKIMVDEICIIPKTVKIIMANSNLMHVIGFCQTNFESGIYALKEFHKVYQLPDYVSIVKIVPLFTEYGQMIIELPILDGGETYSKIEGLNLSGSLHQRNNYLGRNMIPKEKISSFRSTNLSTRYPPVSMPDILDLGSSQRDWKNLDKASPVEWNKFSSMMRPSELGYKSYEF